MKKAIQILNELKREGVLHDYAIGGAVAALFYSEPSFTQDLDVFVIFPENTKSLLITLAPIYGALKKRGYHEKAEYVMIEGVPVQFLPANEPLLNEALQEANEKRYEGTPTRVMRPEHLIAIALQTGRTKDKARVSLLVEQAKIDPGYLKSILKRHHLQEVFLKWTS